MMMLHIKHQNPDASSGFSRCTFAVKVFSKIFLYSLFENGVNIVPVQLGVAFVHPKDHYVKKVGAEKAIENVGFVDAHLTNIEMREPNRVVFHFQAHVKDPRPHNPEGETLVDFGFSFIPESPNVRLEYIVTI
jgi:hypothetical protein